MATPHPKSSDKTKYNFHKKSKTKTFQDSGNQLKAHKLKSIYSWKTTEPQVRTAGL